MAYIVAGSISVKECPPKDKEKNVTIDNTCQLCFEEDEIQQHLLKCKKLKKLFKCQEILIENIEYNNLFKNVKKQKVIVNSFKELLEVRNYILNHENRSNPSILDKMLEKSYDVRKCIVNFSSGTWIIIKENIKIIESWMVCVFE